MTLNSVSPFLSPNTEQLPFNASGGIEPVEERTSDVNFSMGVADRGRTMLRWQPFFFLLHSQLVSTINRAPGLTVSHSPSLASFALYADISMWVALCIVNDTALQLYHQVCCVFQCVRPRQREIETMYICGASRSNRDPLQQ